MASFKLVKSNKNDIDMKEADGSQDSSAVSISFTDPQLTQQALAIEQRKQSLLKQYQDQVRQLDLQLNQLKERQLQLAKSNQEKQKMEQAQKPKEETPQTDQEQPNEQK